MVGPARYILLARMPSAKKNRKLREERKQKSTSTTTIQSQECIHGRPLPPFQGQSLVNQFHEKICCTEMEILSSPGSGTGAFLEFCRTPQFREGSYYDDFFSNMEACFISMGVDFILGAAKKENNKAQYMYFICAAIAIAEALLVVEKFALRDGGDSIAKDFNRRLFRRVRDLRGGGHHAVVRFFAKQIECSCLDEHMRTFKCQPKMGCCHGCSKCFEFMDLRKCTRCKLAHYCSRSCQVSDWSSHKDMCPLLRVGRTSEDIDLEEIL